MTRSEALKLMFMASVAYPSVELTSEEAELWVEMLDEVCLEYAANNLHQHIKTSKFPPTISDILYTKQSAPIDADRYRHNAEFVHHLWDTAEKGRQRPSYDAIDVQASGLVH